MKRAAQKDVVTSPRGGLSGTFGGALSDLTATDLAVHAAVAAIAQAGVPAADYGHVVMGNVAQTSADAIYLARHVGLRAGLPQDVPALTVNRLCGSGFEAVIQAAMLIQLGEAEVVLAGGTESMSQAPPVLRGTRFGFPSASRRRWRTCSGRRSPTAMPACRWRSPPRSSPSSTGSARTRWTSTRSCRSGAGRPRTRPGASGRSSRPSSSRGRRAPSRSIATSTAPGHDRRGPPQAPEGVQGRRHPRGRRERTTARARWSSRRASTRSDAG